MPNQNILRYLRENKNKFPQEVLRRKLIEADYPQYEIEEGIRIVYGGEPRVLPPPSRVSPEEVKQDRAWLKIIIFGIVGFFVIISIFAIIISVSLNSARERARDTRRQSDIRQISLALEIYYDDHNKEYLTSTVDTPVPAKVKTDLSPYLLTFPVDPLSPEYDYVWVDNTTGCSLPVQCYCVYAVLEHELDEGFVFVATEKGTKLINRIPDSVPCF